MAVEGPPEGADNPLGTRTGLGIPRGRAREPESHHSVGHLRWGGGALTVGPNLARFPIAAQASAVNPGLMMVSFPVCGTPCRAVRGRRGACAGHDRGSNGQLLGKPEFPVPMTGDLVAAGLPNELNNPGNFFPQGCARVCNRRQRRGRGAKRFVEWSTDGDFPTVAGNSRQMSDGGYV